MTTSVTEAHLHIDPRVPAGPGLFALTLGGLAIGTTEFATMGVLPDIAGGLHTWPDSRPATSGSCSRSSASA